MPPRYVAALDQGTTSTRCMLFDAGGRVVAVESREHEQIYPRPGWVEHDAKEIWFRTDQVIRRALESVGATAADVAALGVTNQRETTVVWDRHTGEPIANAITWQDTRTDAICDALAAGAVSGAGTEVAPRNAPPGQDRFKATTGLPIAPYFSATKIRWLLDEVPGAAERAAAGDLFFGTVDTWVIWNLTGGAHGGRHVTDVTNASRTLLMDLETMAWCPDIVAEVGIPVAMLPEIRPSSEVYGDVAVGPLAGVPIAAALGDQQAATFGQTCFAPGEAKNTYGTGNF
ncbi:MAG: FGGY family carbohydrate kinase, partial [Solirubrobacteraceae bacterium]|nr:FGGY family carbohydrate kinase [Solirubrobacteraceae bacterium]